MNTNLNVKCVMGDFHKEVFEGKPFHTQRKITTKSEQMEIKKI